MTEQILMEVINFLQTGGDFIVTQAPAYIQEILAYETMIAKVWQLFAIIALCVSAVAWIIWTVQVTVLKMWNEGVVGVVFVFALFSLLFGALVYPITYVQLKKIEISPKVVVMEHLKELVATKCK